MGQRQPGWTRVGFRRAGATAATGGGTITSALGTLTVTNPAGPVTNLETTFGGAPPAIASASSAGSNATSSRSNHTHAADLPAYNPSLAGMQASGVVQQTYAAPTATPAVLTMTVQNIPFGASNGTLTQDAKFQYITGASPHLVISKDSAPPSATGIAGVVTVIAESASTLVQIASARTSAVGGSISWQKARGTWAAPTVVLAGDGVASLNSNPYDGTQYIPCMSFYSFVPTDGTVAANNVSQMWVLGANGGASLGTLQDVTRMAFAADSDRNFYAGFAGLVAASTNGFLYLPAVAATSTGVPAHVFGDLVRAGNRVPLAFNTAGGVGRIQIYNGGAWHFVALDDYSATATRVPFGGATAGTLTDNANMTYTTATQTLTLTGTGGAGGVPLVIPVGDTTGIAISLTNAANNEIQAPAGNIRMSTAGFLTLSGGAGANDFQINAQDDLALGFQNQLAANAVSGFPFIRSIAGPPSGTPTATYASGAGAKMVALTFDPGTNRLWAYNPTAAAWKSIVLI